MEQRLASFKNWPVKFISPELLASAGFFYTGNIDRVVCLSCHVELCRWELGDDPLQQHIKWGGRCRFLKNLTQETPKKCVMCYENNANIAFIPCGHCKICEKCSDEIHCCVICRNKNCEKLRIYF